MVSNCSKISSKFLAFVFPLFLISLINSTPSINAKKINHGIDQPGVESKMTKEMKKLAVKTIQSPDGDIVDCVPTHLQPALNGQMPEETPEEFKNLLSNETWEEIIQVWRSNGESCPENTIPIRRTTQEEEEEALIRASSVRNKTRNFDDMKAGTDDNVHEYAVVETNIKHGEYYGASAEIEVWKPLVEADDASSSQIRIMSGSGGTRNTIVAGLITYPSIYKTHIPRIFIYWTNDDDVTANYDLANGGFVQAHGKIMLGGPVSLISRVGGPRVQMKFVIRKSKALGTWWLFAEHCLIGYWKSEKVPKLGYGFADNVQIGGEVIFNGDKVQTMTQMGSGRFPKEGNGKAAGFADINVQDSDGRNIIRKDMWKAKTYGNKKCYNSDGVKIGDKGMNYFLYGGPGGGDKNCHII